MKRRSLLLTLILVVSALALVGTTMQLPSVWADASCSGNAIGGTTATCNLTHSANVYVLAYSNEYSSEATSVTVGSTGLSEIISHGINDQYINIWGGFVTGAGTNTVTFTFLDQGNRLLVFEAVAFLNVNTGTPYTDLTEGTHSGGITSSPTTLTLSITPSSSVNGQMYVYMPAAGIYSDGTSLAQPGQSAGQTIATSKSIVSTGSGGAIPNQIRSVTLGFEQSDSSSLTLTQDFLFTYTGSYEFEVDSYGLVLKPASSSTVSEDGVALTTTTTLTQFTSTSITTTGATSTLTSGSTVESSTTAVGTVTSTTSGTQTQTTTSGLVSTGFTTFVSTVYSDTNVTTITSISAFTILLTVPPPSGTVYLFALLFLLIPTMLLLVVERSVLALLIGLIVGLVLDVVAGLLPIWVLLIAVALLVLAMFFRMRGGGGGTVE